MQIPLSFVLFGIVNDAWMIPAIGGLVCLLAFVFGWRFLVARPKKNEVQPSGLFDITFQGVTRERRASPRRNGNTVEVELVRGLDEEPMRGWVVNRSIGGLCLLVDHPIPEGTVLRVRPTKASTATPWTDITVRACREEADNYQVGCQFHQTPNWSLLLLFG
jgi:hypothetical protein